MELYLVRTLPITLFSDVVGIDHIMPPFWQISSALEASVCMFYIDLLFFDRF